MCPKSMKTIFKGALNQWKENCVGKVRFSGRVFGEVCLAARQKAWWMPCFLRHFFSGGGTKVRHISQTFLLSRCSALHGKAQDDTFPPVGKFEMALVSFHHVFWAAIWYHSTFRFPPIVALTERFFPPNKALKTVSRIIYSNKPLVQLSSVYKKSSLSLFITK